MRDSFTTLGLPTSRAGLAWATMAKGERYKEPIDLAR